MDITKLSSTKMALLEKYRQGRGPVTSIQRRETGVPAPLSFGQQQMWLVAQMDPHTVAYNECVTIHIPGLINATVLERSFNEIIKRHEGWRTSFPIVDGLPIQMVHPMLEIPLPVIDLRDRPKQERERVALEIATREAAYPFDLEHVPLLRATLIRMDDREHRLFLVLHHIILDGFSLYQILLPELYALYQAFSEERSSPLSPLPIQYPDFAAWQRRSSREAHTQQLAYWKQQLKDIPTSVALPMDHPRPLTSTHAGTTQSFALSKDLTEALKDLSRKEGVTLFMTLVAAFQTLLYRYTGQEDLAIGTVVSDRKYPEVQKVLGYFLNTVVLRSDLSGNPTFNELLRRVNRVALDAYDHQDIPFETVVEAVKPERSVGANPLVQVMLTLQHQLAQLDSGWKLTLKDVKVDAVKFDLYIGLDEQPEGLTGRFEYSTGLFEHATIARMVAHWQALLKNIVAHPEQRLNELSFLTEGERRLILNEWNATRVDYPDQECVQQIFERQVESTPDAIALRFNEQRITYRDLNTQANKLSHYLRQLGVGTATRVGICMDRSVKMVIGLLGILKAGGTYVPVDPAYPSARQEFILRDAQVQVVVTSEKFASSFPAQNLQVVCLDTAWPQISQQASQNLLCEATSDNLAYIMYTSGSTGTPKGVEIRHRSIARLVFGTEYARLDAKQIFLHMAPISFDASTFELWGALLHGASCVLFSELLPTPRAIASIVAKHNVTIVWLTASLFNTVIDEAPEALRGVQQVLTGGEALSVTHVRRALALLPSTQIINGYGPTECTTFACCYPIPRQISEDARSIPIGRPIGNTEAYILNSALKPVPIGIVGELYLGGDGLACGYLNRPEITRENFIPHPFSQVPGARLYKTGDLARYLADGAIEFIGRVDHQVKLRGFRIEPGEIEVVLGRYPGVREALITVHKDQRGEKSLVSYVVTRQGLDVSVDEIRQYLQERLPAYMIPSAFILLEALPLTPNGKIDHAALPDPEVAHATTSDTVIAPNSMEQQVLLRIWEELLEARPIGIKDNFFLLGGDSLLAVRLVHRMELAFQRKVPLSKLIANPTIESLVEALDKENDASRVPVVMIQQGSKSKTPFFFLHGDPNGGAFYCFALAQLLGTDQPFYACAPYRFALDQSLPTFEGMAAAHVEAIRAIQPEGPYLLGGFCNGALVAYEMAHQLLAAHQKVDLLFMVDPSPPAHRKWTRDAVALLSRPLKLRQEQQLDWFLRLHHIYRYIRFSSVRKEYNERVDVPAQRSKRFPLLKALVPPFSVLHKDWFELYRWLMAAYVPASYSGKVAFVWTEQDMSNYKGWERTLEIQGGEAHLLHSGHLDWVSEHLEVLAELLRTSLSKIQKVDKDTL